MEQFYVGRFEKFCMECDRPPILLKYHRRGKKGMSYVMESVASATNRERVGPTVS